MIMIINIIIITIIILTIVVVVVVEQIRHVAKKTVFKHS